MFSLTVTVVMPPSNNTCSEKSKATVREFCALLLMILTVASSVVPALTLSGRIPKESFTLSPPSSKLSSTAVKVKVFSVSPAENVTLAGTPE